MFNLTVLKLKQRLDQAADMITKYETSQEEKNKELQSLKVIFMLDQASSICALLCLKK